MQVGDKVRIKDTRAVEEIVDIVYDFGYGRYGLLQNTTLAIETERGVYKPTEVEKLTDAEFDAYVREATHG